MGVGRGWCRGAFWVYAAGLVVMTHLPGVRTPGMDLTRTDLAAHVGAFGVWTVLFHATGYTGVWLGVWSVARSVAVGAGVGVADELSQGLPGVGRVVDPADAVANTVGVLAAGVVLLVAGGVWRDRGGRGA